VRPFPPVQSFQRLGGLSPRQRSIQFDRRLPKRRLRWRLRVEIRRNLCPLPHAFACNPMGPSPLQARRNVPQPQCFPEDRGYPSWIFPSAFFNCFALPPYVRAARKRCELSPSYESLRPPIWPFTSQRANVSPLGPGVVTCDCGYRPAMYGREWLSEQLLCVPRISLRLDMKCALFFSPFPHFPYIVFVRWFIPSVAQSVPFRQQPVGFAGVLSLNTPQWPAGGFKLQLRPLSSFFPSRPFP